MPELLKFADWAWELVAILFQALNSRLEMDFFFSKEGHRQELQDGAEMLIAREYSIIGAGKT